MHDAIPEEELARFHKHFAIECNNRAWRLSDEAIRYASSSFAFVTARSSPPWEVAFAHAVLAHAAAAARDRAAHATHYRRAKELGAALDDVDRAYFDATFRTIPAEID